MQSKRFLFAIFAVMLLLGAAFFQLCYMPQRAEIARLEDEAAKERAALVAVQNFMNENGAGRSEALAARSAALEKRLPKSMGQGEFLSLLEREAQHEQLTLAAVAPGQMEEAGGIFRLPLDVELDGDYFHLLSFLKEMERSERFIRMESAEIESDDGKLHVKLRFSIFAEKE